MKIKSVIFVLMILLLSSKSFCQEDFTFFDKNLPKTADLYDLVLYSGESKINSATNFTGSDNKVFIDQVGNNNFNYSLISAEESEMRLLQNGNYNDFTLKARVETLEGNVVQNGDNNYSFTFANDPTMEFKLNVDQQGNGHHFESHGTNSIGNDLKFEMSGNSQSIIVRNFK